MKTNDLQPRYKNYLKKEWLLFIEYPNGKHHIFITTETERQLLKRIKRICNNTSDKIAYLDAYEIWNNGKDKKIIGYGEYNYRFRELPNDNNEPSIKLPYKTWEKIASACISVADFGIITNRIKTTLRKTYFTIKAKTK